MGLLLNLNTMHLKLDTLLLTLTSTAERRMLIMTMQIQILLSPERVVRLMWTMLISHKSRRRTLLTTTTCQEVSRWHRLRLTCKTSYKSLKGLFPLQGTDFETLILILNKMKQIQPLKVYTMYNQVNI